MKRGIGNTCLTKDYILSKVSQEAIFSFYTGLDIETIDECIDKGTLISSPFRIDNHPSFGFRYNNKGKLKAKDFAGYFHGDCFDAAAYVINEIYDRKLDINDKKCFIFVLKHIAYSFRNIIYGKDIDYRVSDQVKFGINKIRNSKTIIEFANRDWNDNDKKYWNRFGISLNALNTNFVYAVDCFWINKTINPAPKYQYSRETNNPCYAFVLGRDSNNVYNIKLYFPLKEHGETRFITNTNCLEGLLGLECDNYDTIIITKSTKDRIALQCYIESVDIDSILYGGASPQNRLNIGLVNISSENYKLNQNEYNYLSAKCKGCIYSLMDNDRTGKEEAIWLRDNYNIIPILIPKEYEAKDFAELRSLYSIETINNLVKQLKNYIEYERDTVEWDTSESSTLPY